VTRRPFLIILRDGGNYCLHFGERRVAIRVRMFCLLLYCWSRGALWGIVPTHAERAFFILPLLLIALVSEPPAVSHKVFCSSRLETQSFSYPLRAKSEYEAPIIWELDVISIFVPASPTRKSYRCSQNGDWWAEVPGGSLSFCRKSISDSPSFSRSLPCLSWLRRPNHRQASCSPTLPDFFLAEKLCGK
jgi:hypothetical protein